MTCWNSVHVKASSSFRPNKNIPLILIFAIPKCSGLPWVAQFNQVFRISWLKPVSAIVEGGHSSAAIKFL